MSAPKFSIGDELLPVTGSRGEVLEIREVREGTVIYGLEDNNGRVEYYTERVLRPAP